MMTTDIKHIIQTYLPDYQGTAELITGSGSNRVYLRLTDAEKGSLIGVYGSCLAENRAFVEMAKHFGQKGLPVPKVIGDLSADGHFYLQEDLGKQALYDAIAEGRKRGGDYNEAEQALLHRTMAELPRMQFLGGEGLKDEWCYPKAKFDRESIMFDLNYFKYCFLKAVVDDVDEIRLQREFEQLADDLLCTSGKEEQPSSSSTRQPVNLSTQRTFLYRDFQARNVMLTPEGEPRFIDFQGGRIGPVYYDLASFLWQAAARYPQTQLKQKIVIISKIIVTIKGCSKVFLFFVFFGHTTWYGGS